jgi:phosphoribosylcarboxyaminoimidazole (NCAIR) mutase
MPEVGEILGSKSDLPLVEACLEQVREFGIEAKPAGHGVKRRPLAGR